MPGREKEVWDYYRSNANALAQLRAPIHEDKVVDFILELANVTEKKVSREGPQQGRRGEEKASRLSPAVWRQGLALLMNGERGASRRSLSLCDLRRISFNCRRVKSRQLARPCHRGSGPYL